MFKEPGKPLYSFEHNSDYVYDVQWSPINPALFACVDGTGRLDLWNLINDSEVPTASTLVDGAPALNKIRWHQGGHQLAVGDDQGKISLYDVNESYANARSDDWTRLVRVLQDFKQSQSELDESQNTTSAVIPGAGTPSLSNSNLSTPQQQTANLTTSLPSVKSESNLDYRTPITNNLSPASPKTPK